MNENDYELVALAIAVGASCYMMLGFVYLHLTNNSIPYWVFMQ